MPFEHKVQRLPPAKAGVYTGAAARGDQTNLQDAARKGDLKVVERLLAANADVNAAAANDGQMALQVAAEGGHLEVIGRLLAANADVNAADGKMFLQAATGGQHLEVVERLLAANANVNAAAAANDCQMALRAAAGGGHLEMVERLLAANADVNAAAAGNFGPTALQAAAREGHLEVVERLLAANADVNAAAAGHFCRMALQTAAERGHLKVVERLLAANADVNASAAAGHLGRTALQVAAERGHLEVVERLLAANANVNTATAAGHLGQTALQAAAGEGHLEVVERLLAANADVNVAAAAGHLGWTALQAAAGEGHLEVVERLLAANADVNPAAAAGHVGRTALQVAAERGHLEVVERLLAANANVNAAAAANDGQMALQAAAGGGHLEVVERLLAANADVNAAAAVRFGRTALQTAAERGHLKVVERLLAANADVNAAADDGWTALQAAANGKHWDVVDRLRAAERRLKSELINRQTLELGEKVLGKEQPDTMATMEKPASALNRNLSIEEEVTKAFKNRAGEDFLYDVTVTVSSELLQCFEEELNNTFDLNPVLTVTGGPVNACALPCKAYVEQQWGTIGTALVAGVCQALCDPGKLIYCQGGPELNFSILSLGPKTWAWVHGTLREIITISQALSWLAATFRLPRVGRIHCSDIAFTFEGGQNFQISLLDLYEADQSSDGMCWQTLLPNSVIANNFPVPPRGKEVGLHIPLDVMLDLAGILYQVDLSDLGSQEIGIYFRGISSLLYPTAYFEDTHSVQWHLISTGTNPVPPGFIHEQSWHRISSLDMIGSSISFLGYCGKTLIHLGTVDRLTQYPQMIPSRAERETPPPEVSISGVTLGLSAAGHGNILASGTVKYRNGLANAKPMENTKYDRILDVAPTQPVILFETEEHNERAWMVSQLSVILELVNYWVYKHKLNNHMYADLGPDGGESAKKVLSIRENANRELRRLIDDDSEDRVKDLVKRIYSEMGRRAELDASSERHARGTFEFENERLLGWDLLELPDPPQCSWRRQVAVHKTEPSNRTSVTPSWMALTHYIPVYFCQRFGEVITPSEDSKICEAWNPIPGGFQFNYLTVSISCLANWSQQDGSGGCCEVIKGLYWDFGEESIFDDCSTCIISNHECLKRPQVLVKASNRKFTRRKISDSRGAYWPPIHREGAVVFGITPKTRWRLLG